MPTRPQSVFCDRDGVIIENRDEYVRTWEDVEFLPGSLEGCRLLADVAVPLALVSNQSAVGRGLVSETEMSDIHAKIVEAIRSAGGKVAGSYLCPHCPEDNCDCRKPKPGLLIRGAKELGLDLRRSVMIGDAITDMEAGEAVGAQGILVLTGRGAAQLRAAGSDSKNWTVQPDFLSAVRELLNARDEG